MSAKNQISSKGAVWPVSLKTKIPMATDVVLLPISEKVCVKSRAKNVAKGVVGRGCAGGKAAT